MKHSPDDKAQPLSNEKQRLFEQLLKDGGIALPPRQPIPKRNPAEPCRLTPAQEQFWKRWQARPGHVGQNEVVRLRLSGSLDVVALGQAVNNLVSRHELLRTRFVEVNGQLNQQAFMPMNMEVPLADLSYLPAAAQAADCERLCTEQADMAFDLEGFPLLSSSLIALNSHERLLLLTLHQIICDDWSKKILVDDLTRFYESFIAGTPCDLSEVAIDYGDFAMWQRGRLTAGEFDRHLDYWRQKLGGGPRLQEAGARLGLAADAGGKRGSCKLRLSDAACHLARQTARGEGLTSYMILLTGWQVLLSRYTGQEEITVGAVVTNRNRTELQSLVGPLSNLLLIKLDLSGNPSFRVVLGRLRETLVEAVEHQDVPYEWVVAEEAGRQAAAAGGLPDVIFAMAEAAPSAYQIGGLKITEEGPEAGACRGNLALIMRQAGQGIEGRIEYRLGLIDEEKVARMAAGYQRLIEVMLSDLDCKINNTPPLVD
jgi:hypothetical protein